jgi:translocator protein
MTRKSWLYLFAFVAATLAGGYALSLACVRPNLAWYAGLAKPWFNPPAAVFAPVWSLLYILMAVAAWRVWRRVGLAGRPLWLWFGQLVLNFLWTGLFFAAHRPDWALIELVGLWLAILATMIDFRRIDRPAFWLMAPYFLWVSFAGLLTVAVWRLNGASPAY